MLTLRARGEEQMDWTQVKGGWIHRTRIIGTTAVYYTAWEPTELAGRHSSITTRQGSPFGTWLGQIGTDPDPALFNHLPSMTDERIKECRKAYEERYAVAYEMIYEAWPELRTTGRAKDGEVMREEPMART